MADFGDFDPFTDRLLQPRWLGGSGAAPVRERAQNATATVRGFRNYSEDINIFKVFPISEQKKLRFEAQIGNLFNRTIYCDPATELERRRTSGRCSRSATPRGPFSSGSGSTSSS